MNITDLSKLSAPERSAALCAHLRRKHTLALDADALAAAAAVLEAGPFTRTGLTETARRLAGHLAGRHDLALRHTQALEAIAAFLGLANRHVLLDAVKRPALPKIAIVDIPRPQGLTPAAARFGEAAKDLATGGWTVFPKNPEEAGAPRAPAVDLPSLAQDGNGRAALAAWIAAYPEHNIGVVLGPDSNVFAIDIDYDFSADGQEVSKTLLVEVMAALGDTPLCRWGVTGLNRGTLTLFYSVPHMTVMPSAAAVRLANNCFFSVLSTGQGLGVSGLRGPTGEPYGWRGERTPLNTPTSALPLASPKQIQALVASVLERFGHSALPEPKAAPPTPEQRERARKALLEHAMAHGSLPPRGCHPDGLWHTVDWDEAARFLVGAVPAEHRREAMAPRVAPDPLKAVCAPPPPGTPDPDSQCSAWMIRIWKAEAWCRDNGIFYDNDRGSSGAEFYFSTVENAERFRKIWG